MGSVEGTVVLTEDIGQHLAHWQPLLRLADWDIKIKIAPASWRKSGDIKIDLDDRKAVLIINEQPRSENLEELVVHELVHLRLYSMDQMMVGLLDAVFGTDETDPKREFAYTRFFVELETTTEDLTKALLEATGQCRSKLSFGRLRSQVEDEIGSSGRGPA